MLYGTTYQDPHALTSIRRFGKKSKLYRPGLGYVVENIPAPDGSGHMRWTTADVPLSCGVDQNGTPWIQYQNQFITTLDQLDALMTFMSAASDPPTVYAYSLFGTAYSVYMKRTLPTGKQNLSPATIADVVGNLRTAGVPFSAYVPPPVVLPVAPSEPTPVTSQPVYVPGQSASVPVGTPTPAPVLPPAPIVPVSTGPVATPSGPRDFLVNNYTFDVPAGMIDTSTEWEGFDHIVLDSPVGPNGPFTVSLKVPVLQGSNPDWEFLFASSDGNYLQLAGAVNGRSVIDVIYSVTGGYTVWRAIPSIGFYPSPPPGVTTQNYPGAVAVSIPTPPPAPPLIAPPVTVLGTQTPTLTIPPGYQTLPANWVPRSNAWPIYSGVPDAQGNNVFSFVNHMGFYGLTGVPYPGASGNYLGLDATKLQLGLYAYSETDLGVITGTNNKQYELFGLDIFDTVTQKPVGMFYETVEGGGGGHFLADNAGNILRGITAFSTMGASEIARLAGAPPGVMNTVDQVIGGGTVAAAAAVATAVTGGAALPGIIAAGASAVAATELTVSKGTSNADLLETAATTGVESGVAAAIVSAIVGTPAPVQQAVSGDIPPSMFPPEALDPNYVTTFAVPAENVPADLLSQSVTVAQAVTGTGAAGATGGSGLLAAGGAAAVGGAAKVAAAVGSAAIAATASSLAKKISGNPVTTPTAGTYVPGQSSTVSLAKTTAPASSSGTMALVVAGIAGLFLIGHKAKHA